MQSVSTVGSVPWYGTLTRAQWKTLLAANLGWMFDGYETYALILTVGVALSQLLDASQAVQNPGYAGIVISITLLGWGIGGIVGGILADYIGRRRTMIYAIIAYSLMTGLSALAWDWISFALLRFLVGIAIGSEWATGASITAEVWPDHARGKGAGLMQCGLGIGFFLASFIWLFVSAFGPGAWRIMFLIGVLPALFALWLRTSIPESAPWERANALRRDAVKRQASGAALAPEEQALARFTVVDLFVEPEIRRRALLVFLCSLATTLAWWGVSTWVAPYIGSAAAAAGLPAQRWLGYAGLAYNFGAIIGYASFGFLADRFGRKPVTMAFFALAFVLTPTLFLWTHDLSLLLAVAAINGYFTAGQYSWMPVWLPELFPTRIRATGLAFAFNAPRLIAFLGPLLAGWLIVSFGGYGHAATMIATIYVVGFVAAVFLPETPRPAFAGLSGCEFGRVAPMQRKPVAFGDLRGWIAALKAHGELHEIDAEVDWNIELGTIMRLAQGPGTGRALLFNNIKDYNEPQSRCRRLFGSALNNNRRIAMMLGLPPDAHPRELVKLGRHILSETVPPRIVKDGPVKQNIVTGNDVDLYEFPVPFWNRLDGGRYLITYAGVVTKDPDTGVMNVGIYRGMIGDRDRIPILMWRAQHIGHHVTAAQQAGMTEIPIAVAIGWEPSLGFCAGSPVPKGICEYDVMGAIRGEPVDLVKCETSDLCVPASAEIVIEGMLGLDPETYMMEGPYAEFTGYVAGDRSPKPAIRVTCITHRNDPILRGTIEGCLPGSFSENAMISSIFRSSTAWNVLDRAGVPGITDVWGPPVQAAMNLLIRMKQSYRGQAKQAANAIWGSSAAHVRYKNITVVDDDIDIHDYAAVDWAIAYRVNAGENDIVIMPQTFGLGLDPSTRKRDRNPALFGTGKWNRVLIDATMNLDYDPDPEFDGARFPPTVWPKEEDVEAAKRRWSELGLDKPERD